MTIKFQDLSIGKKISCAVVVFLIPLALLSYYLVTEKEGLIDFTRQEVAGVHYLRATQSALDAILVSPGKESYAKATQALELAEKEDAGGVAVTKKMQELHAAMLADPEGKNTDDALAKAAALNSAISDNSNITLDPDGDAYFVGDIEVNQATGVLTQANALVKAATALDKEANEDNKIAYAEARDGLATSAGNLAADLGKAIKGNADGSLKASMEAKGKALDDAVNALIATTKGTDREALKTAQHNVTQLTVDFTNLANDEMERLLEARIHGFNEVLVSRLGVNLVITLLGSVMFFTIVRSIIKPVAQVVGLMNRLTAGELDLDIPATDRKDEIGSLTKGLQAFHVSALEREKARVAEVERMATEARRAEAIKRITADFEHKVHDIVSTVAAASTELARTAEQVTKMMEKTATDAKNAAQNAVQTTTNVQSVASAVEEMSASVREISAQVQRTNQLANDSRHKTDTADGKAVLLGDAANKVSDAVTLIASIASQINLLALNATIESARAGEAGKGFAVVASEVKNLANQTNKSVEDVGRVIEELKLASSSIIEALAGIKTAVESVSNASSNIAAAVEEQSATTNEITSNMQYAAQGTQAISHSLDSVSSASATASSATGEVLDAAKELSTQSELLNKELGEFLDKMRAA